MLNNYICAVDIGSSKLAAVVAKIKRRSIVNVFFESSPTKGIKTGVIIDSISLIDSLGKVLKNLKTRSGINIKFIYTNISGQDIVTKHSRAIMPLAERGNKVITVSDIQRVNEQARILASSLEEEIIHQIPFDYTIDSISNILNPLGLYSHRLEVDLYLVCARLSSLQSLTRAFNQAGYELKRVFFSALATSNALLNKEFRPDTKHLGEGVDILCDIGSDITEILVFKDGLLKDVEILTLGGNDLTIGLQETLKIPFDLAEDVKCSYGIVGEHDRVEEDKEILVKKSSVYKPIKNKAVSEVLTSQAKLVCKAIKDTVDRKVDCSQVNNFVAVGRAILLEGFLEMIENTLGVSVKIGRLYGSHSQIPTSQKDSLNNLLVRDLMCLANRNSELSGHKYLNYVTSLGLVCEAIRSGQPQILSFSQPPQKAIPKLINKLKEVYQEYF